MDEYEIDMRSTAHEVVTLSVSILDHLDEDNYVKALEMCNQVTDKLATYVSTIETVISERSV